MGNVICCQTVHNPKHTKNQTMKKHILYILTLFVMMSTSLTKTFAEEPPAFPWANHKVILNEMPCVVTRQQWLYNNVPMPWPNGVIGGTLQEGKLVGATSDETFMNGEGTPEQRRPWVSVWSSALGRSGWARVRSFDETNTPDEYWLRPARDTDFSEAVFTPVQFKMHQNAAWAPQKLFLDEVTGGTAYPAFKLDITSPLAGGFVFGLVSELKSTQGQGTFPAGPQPIRSRPRINSTAKQTAEGYSELPVAGLPEGYYDINVIVCIDLAGSSGIADGMWDENNDQIIRRVTMGSVQVLSTRPSYTFEATAGPGGMATVSTPTAKEGDGVTWSATAGAGYQFLYFKNLITGWTTTDNPLTLSGLSSSGSLHAVFGLKPINIALQVPGGGGSISIDPGPHTMGQALVATAIPNSPDDIFVGWQGLASGSQNPALVTVPASDAALIATFRHRQTGEVKFTPVATPGGRIVNAATFTTATSPITVKVEAETGYYLEGLEVNGILKPVLGMLTEFNPLVDGGLSLRLTADTTVRAVFKPTPFRPALDIAWQRPDIVLRLVALEGVSFNLEAGSGLTDESFVSQTTIFGGAGTAAYREPTANRRFYRIRETVPPQMLMDDSFAVRPTAPLWTGTGGTIRWTPGSVILASGQSLTRQTVPFDNMSYLSATVKGTGAITGSVTLTFGTLSVPVGITPTSISLAGTNVETSPQGSLTFLILPPRTPLDTHCRVRAFVEENLVAEGAIAMPEVWESVHAFELKLGVTSGSWVISKVGAINW